MKKQKTEKKKDLKSLKKKRIIVVIALSFLVVLVGATVAYHTSHGSFLNLFRVARAWSNTTYDEFTSPSNWASCEEVPKVVYGKNTGDVPAAVRMKYEEYWKAANSTSTDHTTELPLQDNNIDVAVVNLQNLSDWTNGGDGWYYYNFVLNPGDETTSLLQSVTLNCNNNFAGANDVCNTVNGVTTCTKRDNQYDGAHYHVFVTMEYIENRVAQDEWGNGPSGSRHLLRSAIANQVNDLGDYQIDFSKPATVSDDVAAANGNGVNAYTENGKTIYYFRGNVNNNNVMWGGICWKIIRTTADGGIKMAYASGPYSGTSPTTGESIQFCGSDTVARYSSPNAFNTGYNSPAYVGYTYGDVPALTYGVNTSPLFTFTNKVNHAGDTYYLGLNDNIAGTWTDVRTNVQQKNHYFCLNAGVSCNAANIAYLTYTGNSSRYYYLPLSGYNDINDAITAMNRNTNSSSIKTHIENFFTGNNLDGHSGGRNYEDDLEDAVYCNDREYANGTLKGETLDSGSIVSSDFAGAIRKANYTPSLECNNKRDAFTVSASDKGNGYLAHKVGTITMDEAMLGGVSGTSGTGYLISTNSYWTMTPHQVGLTGSYSYYVNNLGYFVSTSPNSSYTVLPVVTLKPGTEVEDGTDGTPYKPYVVKY